MEQRTSALLLCITDLEGSMASLFVPCFRTAALELVPLIMLAMQSHGQWCWDGGRNFAVQLLGMRICTHVGLPSRSVASQEHRLNLLALSNAAESGLSESII